MLTFFLVLMIKVKKIESGYPIAEPEPAVPGPAPSFLGTAGSGSGSKNFCQVPTFAHPYLKQRGKPIKKCLDGIKNKKPDRAFVF